MKSLKYIISAIILTVGLASCVGDLNVKPIDPSMLSEEDALQTEQDYFNLLTSCYAGFAMSGNTGPGSSTISGLDPGASQYFRGRYHLNGLTTDEAVCGWNDQTIQDLHAMSWTTADVFVASFYYRIGYQISACNNFIRLVNKAAIELPKKAQWIAEARALRAFCWMDGIDCFGNMPFADENMKVGLDMPGRKTRAELFAYTVSELKKLLEGNDLPEYGEGGYGRVDKSMAAMVLAKLYLNAEIYIGEPMYQECADVLNKLETKYSLHDENSIHGTGENAYQELFLADNDLCTDEVIWAVQQDGIKTQSYGVTNYIIFASTGGDMNPEAVGISSGWGGIRTTPQMYDKFEEGDMRKLFYDKETQRAWWEIQYGEYEEGVSSDDKVLSFDEWVADQKKVEQQKEIGLVSEFTHGYAFMKYKNILSNEDKAQSTGFVDVDFPVFRFADVLLMLAECEFRGASLKGIQGLAALNKVRARAGLQPLAALTAEDILDERACELYLEGWRRSDLIRFGKFTSDSYLWAWKGGNKDGQAVNSHLALFPIPDNDLISNTNLVQNPGYKN